MTNKKVLHALLAALVIFVYSVSPARADLRDEEISTLKTQVQELLKRIEALEQGQAKAKEVVQQPLPTGDRGGEVSLLGEKSSFDTLPNYLTRGFEFTGYLRSGYGVNSRGGKMEAFQAPDALAKYRLGNEQDTYLETTFTEKNWNPDPDGLKVLTQVCLSYQTQQNQSWDLTNSVVLREAYAEMSNFVKSDPGMKVWGGERFYRLPQLEINDFWWSDMSGYGGGFEDINFFDIGKLNIAYLGYADTDINLSTSHGRIDKNNLHVMLDEVAMPGGKGAFWVNGGYVRQGNYLGTYYPDTGGVDAGFMHLAKVGDISNQLGLQFGYGACSSLSTGADIPLTGTGTRAWRTRFTDMYNQKFNDRLSLQGVAVYQYTDNGGHDDYNDFTEHWVSFGIRPVYGLTKYVALEVEPGIDYVDNSRDSYHSYLSKVTAALRISPNAAFDSHPRFRLFATYAHWGDSFKGHAGGGSGFDRYNDGLNFGVQCEHWW